MDEKEIWRPVVGYEGLYEVSNLGNVRSLPRDVIMGRGGLYHLPQRLLKPSMDGGGYLQVVLCNNGKRKNCLVHRLVAEAFLPNPSSLPQVNHKDEDKTNAAVSNLEWCSREYNVCYGTGIDRMAATISKPVQQFSLDGALLATWPSIKEAWRQTGVHQGNICSCCNGHPKHRTAGGYKWQYA